jgi:hypothetical protein
METLTKLSQIDRQTLYNEVWSTPMTRLAVKFSVTGADIKKRSVELQIPCPWAGYWSRLHRGYPSEKPSLPPLEVVGIRAMTPSKVDRPRKEQQPLPERLLASRTPEVSAWPS